MRWVWAVCAGLVIVLLASTIGVPCVMIPNGTPTGQANQGTRGVAAGVMGDKVTMAASRDTSKNTDNSVHFLVCYDETLPTEKAPVETKAKLPKGKIAATAKFKIPSGVTTAHWVLLFDKDDEYTFGAEGTLNLD